MADRSNYADKPTPDIDVSPEHRFHLENARGYIPSEGQEDDGSLGGLAVAATDDSSGLGWVWKPWRLKRFGLKFKTFVGVTKSAAELSHDDR